MKHLRNFSVYGAYLAQGGVLNDWFRQTIGSQFPGSPQSPAGASNVGQLIVFIIQILLLVAASIAVIFLIIGGYQYVTARGNEEQAEGAKRTITGAIWGIIIIVMSFVIIRLVATVLLQGAPGLNI